MADENDAMNSAGAIFGVSKKKKKKAPEPAPEESAAASDEVEAAEASASDMSGAPAAASDEAAELAKAKAALELAQAKLAAAEAQAKLAELESKSEAGDDSADADDEAEEEEEPSEPDAVEPKKEAPAKKDTPEKKPKAAVAGVFSPTSEPNESDYLSPADVGDYDEGPKSSPLPWVAAVIGIVLVGAIVIMQFGSGEDVGAVMKGELREKRLSEKVEKEEQFRKEQLEALDRFGLLILSGAPLYANIQIDGRTYYGQARPDCPECPYLELRLGPSVVFQNVKVKEKHQIVVTAPGFEPKTLELTEGKWQRSATGGDETAAVNANLDPISLDTKAEFDARLTPDVDTEYFGKVTIKSTPPGAKILWHGKPLLDAKGSELVTPVEFDKYWVKDEKTGRLEENKVNVDTTLDIGHTINLEPADPKLPKFRMALQRQMWTCNWKEDVKLKPEESLQKKCDYTYDLDFDFHKLAEFIKWRAEEEARVKARNAEILNKAATKAKGDEG